MTRPKLLLADDSVTIRKVVELTFADEGIDVTTVADGEGAMSKFVEMHPDIVLVDVGLPGTDGYQICEMIKTDESTSHIPVLLLVGSFEPFDQDAAERSGADGFLTKPFHSIRDLVNRVHELLGTQRQHGIDNVIDFETTVSNGIADDEDIDALYERSFAKTVPIENYETVPAFRNEDAFEGESGAATEETVDASRHSVDEWLDDEMIETVSSTDPAELQQAEGVAIEAAAEYDDAPAAAVDIEPIKEFDWSPAAIVTAGDEKEMEVAAGFSGYIDEETLIPQEPVQEEHVTEKPTDLSQDEGNGTFVDQDEPIQGSPSTHEQPAGQPSAVFAEPTPELVDLIVQRVIERLSDRAVREVAQEAVPRIAEKLMREALEEERNR